VRRAALRYAGALAWRLAGGALRDPEFVRYQALATGHVVARLREGGCPGEALLLAPYAALLGRAAARSALRDARASAAA
jgi:hypothetical protein